MPIYEYRCEECGHLFERLAKNSQDQAEECPACRKPSPKKLFSSFAPAMGSNSGADACPGAAEFSSGGCCAGGACDL